MRRYIIILGIAAIAAIAVSCGKPEPEPQPEAALSLDKSVAAFEAEGGFETVNVTSNVAWTAAGPEWISIAPASGNGDTAVKLTAAVNEVQEARSGKVTFTYSDKTAEVSVNQAAAAAPEVQLPTTSPVSVDKTSILSGQSVKFSFDTAVWTMASDIKWSWVEDSGTVVKEGAVVETPVEVNYGSIDDNTPVEVVITASATVKNETMTWPVKLTVTPYFLYFYEWGVAPQGNRYSCPAFSVDKATVYVVTDRKGSKLFAFDTGKAEKKWEFDPGANMVCCTSPTVNPVNGDIYYVTTTAKVIFAVKSDGTQRWKYEGLESVNKNATPVVSKDGKTVFFSDGSNNVHAVNAETGEKVWGVTLGAKAQAMVLNGNELFCACAATTGGGVFLKAEDGSEIAKVDLYKASVDAGAIAVDPVKKIAYVPSAGSNQTAPTDLSDYSGLSLTAGMTAVDLVKHEVVASADIATNAVWGPVILADGDIVISDKDGYIARLESGTLKQVWKIGSWKRNSYNYGQPVVDTDGNIFFVAGHNTFAGSGHTIKVSPDGKILADWANTRAENGPMGGTGLCNGFLYILGHDPDNVVSKPIMAKYVGTDLATTGWPCHGGNLQGTGCL